MINVFVYFAAAPSKGEDMCSVLIGTLQQKCHSANDEHVSSSAHFLLSVFRDFIANEQ